MGNHFRRLQSGEASKAGYSQLLLDFPSLQQKNMYETNKLGNRFRILQTGEASDMVKEGRPQMVGFSFIGNQQFGEELVI